MLDCIKIISYNTLVICGVGISVGRRLDRGVEGSWFKPQCRLSTATVSLSKALNPRNADKGPYDELEALSGAVLTTPKVI